MVVTREEGAMSVIPRHVLDLEQRIMETRLLRQRESQQCSNRWIIYVSQCGLYLDLFDLLDIPDIPVLLGQMMCTPFLLCKMKGEFSQSHSIIK